jgi:hypothetical protein
MPLKTNVPAEVPKLNWQISGSKGLCCPGRLRRFGETGHILDEYINKPGLSHKDGIPPPGSARFPPLTRGRFAL